MKKVFYILIISILLVSTACSEGTAPEQQGDSVEASSGGISKDTASESGVQNQVSSNQVAYNSTRFAQQFPTVPCSTRLPPSSTATWSALMTLLRDMKSCGLLRLLSRAGVFLNEQVDACFYKVWVAVNRNP